MSWGPYQPLKRDWWMDEGHIAMVKILDCKEVFFVISDLDETEGFVGELKDLELFIARIPGPIY